MSRKEILKLSFIKSIPILCSYLFVSMAYGMMMEEAGFHWYWSLFVSMTVYTGAFQFLLITLLSSGASIFTIALTAFFMNSRQVFYSLTFVNEFKKKKKRLPYLIHTMTDETYAINCSLTLPEEEKQDVMFYVAFFSRCYWMIGAVLGGMIGQILPFDMEGIDFCMTALFVIIFIDQWEHATTHRPALLGIGIGMVCLLLFGKNSFMLQALLFTSGILLAGILYEDEKREKNQRKKKEEKA